MTYNTYEYDNKLIVVEAQHKKQVESSCCEYSCFSLVPGESVEVNKIFNWTLDYFLYLSTKYHWFS